MINIDLINKYLSTFKIVDIKNDVYTIEYFDVPYKEYISYTELLKFICEECWYYKNKENSINLTCIVLNELRSDLLKINIRDLISITNLFIRFCNCDYTQGIKLKEIFTGDILKGKFDSYIFYINNSNISYDIVYKIFDGALYYIFNIYKENKDLIINKGYKNGFSKNIS